MSHELRTPLHAVIGLGLTISARLVALMGGRLEIETLDFPAALQTLRGLEEGVLANPC